MGDIEYPDAVIWENSTTMLLDYSGQSYYSDPLYINYFRADPNPIKDATGELLPIFEDMVVTS